MKIRRARGDEIEDVIKFYHSQGYYGGDNMEVDEFILIAEDEGEIIGATRLVKEESTHTLRGMFKDEKFQRQGLGKKMLTELNRKMGTNEYYCLSRTHLEDFYGRIDFKKISSDSVPGHLRKRYEKVRLKYDVIAMRKDSGGK